MMPNRGMFSWPARVASVCVPALLAFSLSVAGSLPVIVFSDSPAMADLVEIELSKEPKFAMITRREALALLHEGALAQGAADAGMRVSLGRILGAERIVHLRAAGNEKWQIQIVDAASGRLLASQISEPPGDLAREVAVLLNLPHSPTKDHALRIALPDFITSGEGLSIGEYSAVLGMAGRLRLQLKAEGLDVLDRAVSAQVGNEQMLAEKGWLDTTAPISPMLGADLLVAGTLTGDRSQLAVAILSPVEGSLVVKRSFPIPPTDAASALDAVHAWIVENLPRQESASVVEPEMLPSQIEALEPFYRGLGLYQEGKILEATAEFQHAYSLNDKFEEALLWEARCYDRVGLPSLAAAVRSYVELDVVGRGVSSMAGAVPVEGLTFLGIADLSGQAAVRQQLEFLTTEAAAKERHRVLLPENLALLRDEYDTLLGVENSRGHTWLQSPGFLMSETLSGTVSREASGWSLRLAINETLQGNSLATCVISLPQDINAWSGLIADGLRGLFRDWDKGGGTNPVAPLPLPDLEEIKDGLGKTGNLAILQLALKAPDALATDWRPLEKPSNRLPIAMNLGLREDLLDKVSTRHPKRPWMELERIAGFLSFNPTATKYSRTILDPLPELEAFVRRHPDDQPGLVAEYMLLWETMARLPAEEVERRFAALDEKLRGLHDPFLMEGWGAFCKMPGQLRLLAAAAQGKDVPLPVEPSFAEAPHRMIPKVGERSVVSLESKSRWAVNEWRYVGPDSPRTVMHEGRAALALLGRGNNRFGVDPAWLKEFPDSVGLTSYVIRGIRMANIREGLPLRAPFDARREKAHYREMVAYAFSQLRRQISIVREARELDWIENTPLREFFAALSLPGFRKTVPDEEMETMREKLAQDVEAANARFSRSQRSGESSTLLDWKAVNRTTNSQADEKFWRFDQEKAYDRNFLRTQAQALLSEPGPQPLFSSTWYQRLRGRQYRTLPLSTLGEYYRAALPRLLADYSTGELGTFDREKMLQFGGTLLAGGFPTDAETVFLRAAGMPENDLNKNRRADELRANANLNLGALAIHFGRESEGADLLRKAIAVAGGSSARVVRDFGWNTRQYDTVQSVALRLLSDLREQIPANKILHSVGQVRVRAPGYFPGEPSYFFRVPSGFDPASGRTYRVLLVVPSINQDAAEYCKFGHTWARFADRHDLFLVVPRFMQFWSDCTMPQEWSGEVTLQALQEIRKTYPIETDRLLLHGYGRGAAFLQRFALWKPALCRAVSLHSTYDWAWQETLPEGFGSLSDLKGIPFLITCGERDGAEDQSLSGAYASTVRLVTYAMGAGLSVTWKSLPDVVHRPSPDMEKLAQDFLAAELSETPGPAEKGLRNPGGSKDLPGVVASP